MHAKSFVLALALASSSVVEANRPRIYYPRQVKREVVNNAAAAPAVPENKVVPDLEKRDPQNSFLDRLFNNNNNDDTASNGDKESGINFDPTIPLGFKRPGPSASALPSVVLQPTTTSMAIEEPQTTEPAEATDALAESDTGILLAPSGIVTSKTAVKSTKPAKTSAAEPKEETEAVPVETETVVQTEEPVVTTEPPKEETQPAATTAPAVKQPESVNTPKEKPVESKTEEPAPVETTEPAEQPASTPSNKPAVSTTKKGLLDPVETLLSSVLPVPAESKTTQPKSVNTETSKPKEETQPAPVETSKPKEETQPAPVQTESVQPADSETKSPSVEKPAPTTKEGLLDPVETLLSSVLPVPADSETKDPQPDQTESEPLPEETGTPTKQPQQQESKPQTEGQTLPTVSPPSDEPTAAPGTAQTSKDGLLDPVETLLSS
jgi:hypothetical protein